MERNQENQDENQETELQLKASENNYNVHNYDLTTAPAMTKQAKKKEKRLIYLSMIILWFLITLVCSALNALFNSMTSLIPKDSLGNTVITILCASQMLSSAFLASFVIQRWGIKKMIIVATISSTLFTATLFYPVWFVIGPSAVVSGISFNILLTTWFAYGNNVARWYMTLFQGNKTVILSLMAGIINVSLSGGFLWGNVILYFILHSDPIDGNDARNVSKNENSVCAIDYCNEDLSELTVAEPPSEEKYYILIGVFTAMTVAGAVGSFFIVDIPKRLGSETKKKLNCKDFLKTLQESWHMLKQPKGFLPVFLIFFAGFEEAFTLSVFTQAFITCNIGISKIGFIMFTYGLAEIVMSGSQWIIIKNVGRPIVMFIVYCAFMGSYIYLLISPSYNEWAYFVVVALFGAGDANLIATIFSIYGFLYEDKIETAFALVNLLWGLGLTIPLLCNPFLCVRTKVYILLTFGTLAFAVYFIVEMLIRRHVKKNAIITLKTAYWDKQQT